MTVLINALTRKEPKTVTFENESKAVTLKTKSKTKTVEILSRDSLETRRCLEASHHFMKMVERHFKKQELQSQKQLLVEE